MKVLWLFPPSIIEGAMPNISQYRFFKYMNTKTSNPFLMVLDKVFKVKNKTSIIYPYIASVGYALVKSLGIDIDFMDCPTDDINELPTGWNADWIILEGRTPTIMNTYAVADYFRNEGTKVLMYGDHVISHPAEARQHCDVIIMCGDYDWGIYQYFKQYQDCFGLLGIPLCQDLDVLPYPDRERINWSKYYEAWKHRDKFFWTMSMRGCFYDCVDENALITMKDESKIRLADVRVGDDVYIRKNEFGTIVVKRMITKGCITLNLVDDKSLTLTPDHRVFTKRGFVKVKDLKPDDEVGVED